ncbi:cinnamate beta-D-glucosyltransferase-like protein [Carex littledalei]|uniref:Glycosyltransferase n=1 Tax=Carex littledalei TaxID=544730 RepID=A0A833QID2_9POAL|nr:cinnamate beta-D-glucosyltransferase-like protein [Carex littledalei]
MESEPPMPHVLMISFPGQGHVNPLLRLAKRIAAKGVLITFSTTSDTGHQIISSSDVVSADDGVPVGNGHLRFEFLNLNWDKDGQKHVLEESMLNLDTVGPAAFADLIRKQSLARRPVTYVVNNPFIPWAVDVATDMGIPCAVLWVQSCAVFSTYYHYHHGLSEFPTETNPDISVCLPGIPIMTPEEIPSFLLPTTFHKSLTKAILEQFRNIDKASRVFVNSFTELEPEAINSISKYAQLIPVGPLVEPEDNSGSNLRGDLFKPTDCLEWLDTQAPQSVIYISLGSIVTITKEEMVEMANGLTTNGRSFLWVVRSSCQELLPQGFLEKVKGKGLVVGWSPQDNVLNHSSIGCFLTHCGWNSVLETLTAGVPVIAYPQFGDQLPDAKFLVDIYKVGVRLKSPVQCTALHAAIEAVMDGTDANGIKENATKWKIAAKTAVAKGGSSDRNIEAFVDEVMKRAAGENDCFLQV